MFKAEEFKTFNEAVETIRRFITNSIGDEKLTDTVHRLVTEEIIHGLTEKTMIEELVKTDFHIGPTDEDLEDIRKMQIKEALESVIECPFDDDLPF